MKPKPFIFISFFLFASTLTAQYKNDNVLYKTVYLEDLCEQLKEHPDYIFLDVRSKGEHYDTSSYAGMNIGHLKNAINIPVQELESRMSELEKYKDKEIIVYCSHSHRSPRASYMLTQNGFKKVTNMLGGMSVWKDQVKKNDCNERLYQQQ